MDKSEKDKIKNLIDFGDSADAPPEPEAPAAPDIPDVPDAADATIKIDIPAQKTESAPPADAEETQIINLSKNSANEGNADIFIDEEADIEDDSGPESDMEDDTPRKSGAELDFDYGFDDGAYEDDEPKPESKTFRIVRNSLIAAAVIAAAALFAITDTGIIGAYKRNFKHNFSKIFGLNENPSVTESYAGEALPDAVQYDAEQSDDEIPYDADRTADTSAGQTVYTETQESEERAEITGMSIKSSVIIPYDYASESDYSAYNGGIICAATNYMCFINNRGETEWECATSVIDPILKTAGNYILIAQEGGTKLCLYNNGALVYDIDCEDSILSADLSANGDCVLVTTKDLYKGAIAAYNRSGQRIYARSSGGGSVIDASISPSSRNIAVSLLDTDNAVRSTVEIFDITKNDPIASIGFDDTILFDVEYFGNTVNAFGDNCIAGLKSNGEVIYDYRFEGMELNHYAYDEKGNKLLLFDASNIPTFMLYNLNGRERGTLTSLEMADYLCIGNGRIIYNNDRSIIAGRSNGKSLERYTASMDIRRLVMVDKKTFFIVYSNSLELVRK